MAEEQELWEDLSAFRMDPETIQECIETATGCTVNGLMRGENDAECLLDCYEGFFDFEVEETGERGYGVAEYSIEPAYPRWRY